MEGNLNYFINGRWPKSFTTSSLAQLCPACFEVIIANMPVIGYIPRDLTKSFIFPHAYADLSVYV